MSDTLTGLFLQPSTITCCDRFDKHCVNIDNAEPAHRTELIQNYPLVDPIEGCTKINLYDPNLQLTLQCTFQCMRHSQWCITSTQTFLISKLDGWKHTTAFHKSSEAKRHQVLKHLRQYRCYENQSVVDKEDDGGPFLIEVTLACL